MKENDNTFGGYLNLNNTIYFNPDKIQPYPNVKQQFLKTLFHELVHAKQKSLIDYAVKNQNNKKLSEEDRKLLEEYLKINKISKKTITKIKKYQKKFTLDDVKNNKNLAKELRELHNIYENTFIELEADNVALAILAQIGQSHNRFLQNYSRTFRNAEELSKKTGKNREIAEIRSAIERHRGNHFGFGRLSNLVDTTTYFQSAYHGTPHKFDEFSLDNIGTGEGAQAHGWGLYFAENKEVSEGYRKRLTPVAESILYKGESPKYIEFKSGFDNSRLLDAILYRGKEGVLKQLENNRPFGEDTDELIEYVKSIDEKELIKETNGQLFEVDIPDKDVLLDEDKKFSEQPEKVKNAIRKIAKDYNIEELKIELIDDFIKRVEKKYGKQAGKIVKEIYDAEIENNEYDAIETNKMVSDAWDKWNQFELDNDIDRNKDNFNINEIYNTIRKDITGKEIYRLLVNLSSEYNYANSQKDASQLLNKYGIKGITYDGRQDGRCYVIFDDKAIKILQKFYQPDNINSPKNKEYYNLDGTKVNDPTNPLDFDYIHTQFEDIPEEQQEKIKIEINPELETRKNDKVQPKTLKDTKLNLLRTKTNTPKKIENSLKKYLFDKNKKETTAKNINTKKEVIINASSIHEMVNEVHNVYTDIENKAEFRETLYNVIANSKDLFGTAEYILSYDEVKKESLKNKQKVDRYANIVTTKYGDFVVVFTIFNRKDIQTIKLYDIEDYQKSRFSQPRQRADKTGMPLTESINSISYLTDFVKSRVVEKYNNDYKNSQSNNIHYQSDNEFEGKKGFTYQRNLQGAVENVIVLLKGKADVSTLPHEFAHIYLDTLNILAKENAKAQDLLNTVNKFLRYDGNGEYTEAQHEKFARNFVAYMRTGKAPTYRLKRVFENFRRWLNDIKNKLENSGEYEMDDGAKQVFDELIGDISVESQMEAVEKLIQKARDNAKLRIRFDEESRNNKINPNQLTDRQRRYSK
ncbi:hypothetical protein II906_04605 [bacterium]|nr:hypothetical protein [bacterium]